MAYTKITDIGKNFIRKTFNYSEIYGGLHDSKYSILDGIRYESNSPINTPDLFIDLLESSALEFDIDANILAANTYVESNFKFWEYSSTGALGISQITRVKWADFLNIFSIDDKNKKFDGIVQSPEEVKNKNKKRKLKQNILNNPEICIRYQAFILSRNANACNNLASVTLISYNQGEKYLAKTLEDSLNKLINDTKADYRQAVNHVIRVFGHLQDNFGYEMTKKS